MGDRLPSELSGGQQQRVAVARALVLEPQVLLLDEPLSNLDARLRRRVRTEIRELQQRLGFTAVYVTHDQEEALAVSDRIVVMQEGRIAQQGTPRELYEAPASEFIADFIGEANVIDCEVEPVDRRHRHGRHRRPAPAGAGARRAPRAPRKLAVRANAIRLQGGRRPAGRAASSRPPISATTWSTRSTPPLGRLFAIDAESETPHPQGSRVALGFRPPRPRPDRLRSPMDLSARLGAAEDIARRAGALALRYFRDRDSLHVEAKRTLQDMVSEADREVETLIRDALADGLPRRRPTRRGARAEPRHVRPDLGDRSDRRHRAVPRRACPAGASRSAPAMRDGPVIGVIHAPVLGETFVAARGHGARLDGTPIRVTDRFDLSTGLLGVGANDRVPAERVGEMLAALMAAGASWTRYGSGALMLAWVAAGRLVGYVEPRMSAWDCMAGYCLIEEAGGRTLRFPDGDAPDPAGPGPRRAARDLRNPAGPHPARRRHGLGVARAPAASRKRRNCKDGGAVAARQADAGCPRCDVTIQKAVDDRHTTDLPGRAPPPHRHAAAPPQVRSELVSPRAKAMPASAIPPRPIIRCGGSSPCWPFGG